MFEYQDEFLMNITTNAVGAEDMYYLCSANNTAEDQLAELARLVGSGGAAPKEKSQPITLVDSAPKLEFDLEEELSKAFASVPYSSPEHTQVASETPPGSIAVMEEIAAPAEPQPVPQPAPVAEVPQQAQPIVSQAKEEISQSDLDLGDLISKEFELALQEEAEEPVSKSDAEFVEAIEKASDTFDAELARLMGSERDGPDVAQIPPPAPEPIISPPDEPIIVKTPTVPTISEPDVVASGADNNHAAQMSDFDLPNMPLSSQEDLVNAKSEPTQEHTQNVTENSQISDVEPASAATSNVAAEPAVDPAAAAPIVGSEINLDDLNEQNPPFHDDEISIPEPHAAAIVGQNRKTGRRAAGSLVAIALVAGFGLAGWNAMDGGNKSVPTILASTDPVKVKPKEAGGTVVPNQDQAVYRSVESSKKNEPKQKSLNDNSEKPIVVANKVDTKTEKFETRIKRNEQSTESGVVVAPRKVRTVVVKPDGTILQRSSGVKEDSSKLALNTASMQPKVGTPKLKADILAPNKVKLKKIEAKTVAPVKKPVAAEKIEVVKKPVPTKKVAAKKTEPVKKVVVAKKPTPTKKVASVKKPVPTKKPKLAQEKSESVKTTASVRSPYAVQVASQRSPEAAERTYKVLARRYASVFRGKSMDIRKADIKGKGTYYRARIPAQTKASARKICQRLKAKGGDCFVTR